VALAFIQAGRAEQAFPVVKRVAVLVQSVAEGTETMRASAGTLILGVALLLLAAAGALAAQYPGWGDTGWVYANKRDCCAAAIEIAASYSASACATVGGLPAPFRGAAQRGTCSAQWTQDENGTLLYRCSGEASVWCR
jgi:hypothetical protein